jgi:protein ImuB
MSRSSYILRAMLPLQNTIETPCWLALRLPHLALDHYTRGQAKHDLPLAISDTIKRREVIIDANPTARKAGVRPGMLATAALSIINDLQVLPRQQEQEREALQRLAAWCYQYSSQVVIPSDRPVLLLEAGASERLFGAPPVLAQRLENELGQLGYHVMAGSAPTFEAAWLAAGEAMHIKASGQIRSQLGPLPLQQLHLLESQHQALDQMGFRQIRDVLRLPRKALTRRFGPDVTDYIDRLLGSHPDPRQCYEPPQSFSSRLDLPAEINASQALLFPLKRLLDELCGVLRGGDRAVQSLDILLLHEDHPESSLQLGVQSPTQDSTRLLSLLRERLERLRLPQAVREIRLDVPKMLQLTAGQRSLFRDSPTEQQQNIEQLAERLQARLGRNAVAGLAGVEDHRPEYSWRPRSLDEKPKYTSLPHRPAWLLPKPKHCDIGRYEILAGPERIESGWWDGRDCRRDYFIVRDSHGSTLWAFHEYKPRHGWYLHGIFA